MNIVKKNYNTPIFNLLYSKTSEANIFSVCYSAAIYHSFLNRH